MDDNSFAPIVVDTVESRLAETGGADACAVVAELLERLLAGRAAAA